MSEEQYDPEQVTETSYHDGDTSTFVADMEDILIQRSSGHPQSSTGAEKDQERLLIALEAHNATISSLALTGSKGERSNEAINDKERAGEEEEPLLDVLVAHGLVTEHAAPSAASATTAVAAATNDNEGGNDSPIIGSKVAPMAPEEDKKVAAESAESFYDRTTEMKAAREKGPEDPLIVDEMNLNFDLAVDPLPVARTTIAPATNPSRNSQPGAFAVGGIGVTDPGSVVSFETDGPSLADHAPTTPMTSPQLDNTQGLATATHVHEEPNDEERQQAEEVDLENEQRMKILQENQRKRKALGFALWFFLALVLAIILGLSFQRNPDTTIEVVPASSNNNNHTTSAPIITPTKEERITSLLPNYTQLHIEISNSPQRKAFDWLINDPNLDLYPDDRILQRYALATLYYATKGFYWANQDRWLNYEYHECDWFARNSSGLFYYPGPNEQLEWNVTGGPCGGSQNPMDNAGQSFYELEHLQEGSHVPYQHIWLWSNDLNGVFPNELFLLTSLRSISVDRNRLRGILPTFMGQLTKLEALGLYSNDFSGTLPTEMGQMNLTHVWIMAENWTGTIPTEIFLNTNLEHLLMDSAGLTGTIPSELGRLDKLTWLWIEENNLDGSIPSEVGLMAKLQEFDVVGNDLTGTLPSELGQLTNLELLNIYTTLLTGPIPSELGMLNQSLQLIWSWSTLFTGTLPTELRNLQAEKLQLALDNNLLTGSIPSQLGNAKNFFLLHLGANQLTGRIPSELGKLWHLNESFIITDNLLTGAIPSEIFAAFHPWRFWVSKNMLSGEIPTEIGLMSSVEMLRLQNNSFSGNLPSELGVLTGLFEMSVAGNNLSGMLPSELMELTSMERLHFHNNSFIGTLSPELASMTILQTLSVANNNFEGSVPSGLCELLNGTIWISVDCDDGSTLVCDCDACECTLPENDLESFR